jgi:hypothetical protein
LFPTIVYRKRDSVGINEHQQVTLSLRRACIACCADSPMADRENVSAATRRNGGRRVRRCIIHNDDFVRLIHRSGRSMERVERPSY